MRVFNARSTSLCPESAVQKRLCTSAMMGDRPGGTRRGVTFIDEVGGEMTSREMRQIEANMKERQHERFWRAFEAAQQDMAVADNAVSVSPAAPLLARAAAAVLLARPVPPPICSVSAVPVSARGACHEVPAGDREGAAGQGEGVLLGATAGGRREAKAGSRGKNE